MVFLTVKSYVLSEGWNIKEPVPNNTKPMQQTEQMKWCMSLSVCSKNKVAPLTILCSMFNNNSTSATHRVRHWLNKTGMVYVAAEQKIIIRPLAWVTQLSESLTNLFGVCLDRVCALLGFELTKPKPVCVSMYVLNAILWSPGFGCPVHRCRHRFPVGPSPPSSLSPGGRCRPSAPQSQHAPSGFTEVIEAFENVCWNVWQS